MAWKATRSCIMRLENWGDQRLPPAIDQTPTDSAITVALSAAATR